MSKSSDKQKASKTIQHKAADYDSVFSGVVEMLDAARRASARVVNTLMTATYWEIGRRIVEHEQAGEKRAEYGEELVRRLATDLTKQFGRGFGFSQLKMMRQFYQTFPDAHTAKPLILQSTVEKSGIGQSVIGQSGNLESSLVPIGQSLIGQFRQRSSVNLSRAIEHLGNIARAFPLPWTHYVRLLRVRSLHAREFYVREALAGGWSVRQLDRQINSQFYERTALSKNKRAMLLKGEKPKPEDAVSADEEIRNPLVLEFLGLKDEYAMEGLHNKMLVREYL